MTYMMLKVIKTVQRKLEEMWAQAHTKESKQYISKPTVYPVQRHGEIKTETQREMETDRDRQSLLLEDCCAK